MRTVTALQIMLERSQSFPNIYIQRFETFIHISFVLPLQMRGKYNLSDEALLLRSF